MSPKTSKNKKESKDSKRPDSSIDSRSAPNYDTDFYSLSQGSHDKEVNIKVDEGFEGVNPTGSGDFDLDEPVPELPKNEHEDLDADDNSQGGCKATTYFDTFAKAIIKVFGPDKKQLIVFPMLVRNFIGRRGYFYSLKNFNHIISDMIDSELHRMGYVGYFISSYHTGYGFEIDLRIASNDPSIADEYYLSGKNYQDHLFSSYMENKIITLHVHVGEDILRPIDRNTTQNVKTDDIPVQNQFSNVPYHDRFVKDEKFSSVSPAVQHMFRGHPIDFNPSMKRDPHVTPVARNGLQTPVNPSSNQRTNGKVQSPTSIYDDEDYLVQDPDHVFPFGQQSVTSRINDLQTAALVTIPDVSTLPKLLKAHNVAYKDGDNAASWYLRFNNFCLMLGIYLPPPNAMEKNSEMGKEWDSKALPHVFYSRFNKMERVLSHILFSPEFFPKAMSDDLHLNPKPYNFLRLFMALHSNSVPDLSDRVIKRPGPMKNSQSLSQYALSWVNYFTDECNVNGISYSKFRQYCYFIDGIAGRYNSIKKFLELEFTSSHDRINNIPISLELRNIPTTIISLCNIHGISISQQSIHQVDECSDTIEDNCCVDEDGVKNDTFQTIRKVQFDLGKQVKQIDKYKTSVPASSQKVQCWLCDGPHAFRQCSELVRMKNICFKRPQVRKHFQQLLLNKNGDAIKVLLDAPELFDDSTALNDNAIVPAADHVLPDNKEDTDPLNERVNSLRILDGNTFTMFTDGVSITDVTSFPEKKPAMHQIIHHDDDDDPPHFHVLGIYDAIPVDPAFHHKNMTDTDSSRLLLDTILQSSKEDLLSFQNGLFITDSPPVSHPVSPSISIKSVSFDDHSSKVRYHRFTTQVDGGADRCTTPHRSLVNKMRPPNPALGEPTIILDAGKHKHRVEGIGHFSIETWVDGRISHSLTIPCAYIPTIPSTLVNFRLAEGAIMYGEVSNLVTGEAIGTLIVGSPEKYAVHKIPLQIRGQRVYASNLLSTDVIHQLNTDLNAAQHVEGQIAIVSDEATRLLWHARLGHLNFRALASMHNSAKGVPKFKQSHVTDQCATCLETKLRRSPRGHGTIANRADVHGQVLCADWGFVCQNSSDPTRITRLASVYGDTSYLIFVCAHTGALYGVCAGSKSVPTKWLHTFLHRISYSVGSRPKTILVDRGSELGRSNEFRKITDLHGYKSITSGPDKSSMNALGERPHSTIGNALRSILHASGLDLKYWNFAFYHFIRLFNFFPHGNRDKSPFELIRGYKPDLSLLRVFGCNVYIRPPGRRTSKLEPHVIKGRFLGYTSTMKQIYYLEDNTNKIKIAAHARFDEGLASVPLHDLPPYACQLRKALGHSVPLVDASEIGTPEQLDIMSCPDRFPVTFTHDFRIKNSDIMNEYDTLGFILKEDPVLMRCYIADVLPRSTASQYRNWRSKLIGAFILTINDDIVMDRSETEAALSRCLVDYDHTIGDVYVSITFAHDRSLIRQHIDPDLPHPSPIQLDQICHLSQIYETGEEFKYQPHLDIEWVQYFNNLLATMPDEHHLAINKTSSSQFTRKQLMSRPDFPQWQEAEFRQLDTHDSDRMFGDPCPRPSYAIVLRSIWSYSMKWDGTKKARHCGDGRPLRDDRFRRIEAIYTACVSQVGVKLFFALAALLNYVIYDLDAINAFGQAGELFQLVYLEVDQQYRDWYLNRKGKTIPNGWVLPVKGSIQGHPDSGEVWQTKINDVIDSYGFTSTTHEPCLYRGKFKSEDLLLCRQVDDMLIAGQNAAAVMEFAKELSLKLKVTCGDAPSTHFNGLDILQTREGIRINCFTYIEKLRKAHGWNEISTKPLEPISPSKVKELEDTVGPPVDSKEGKLLQQKNGFNYRGVVGEIVYAYVVARPDYGFAVALLSRFNTCPSQCHYDAAKRCLKSLIRSAEDGIWYWRREPRNDLPPSGFEPRPIEPFEKEYPVLEDPFLVSGMCDVSLAPNILMRRSFGGTFVFLGCLALIMYLAKLQPTVVTSIGEGEFIQLVLSGKKIKYVRTVMNELGFVQKGPSPIFGDNLSSIMMGNNIRPTDRTRHMDIKWFALQEWIHIDKDIILIHIPGDLNASDALTKALAWIKHYRHVSRAMGATGPIYLNPMISLIPTASAAIKALFITTS